jgi:hypothetical protein
MCEKDSYYSSLRSFDKDVVKSGDLLIDIYIEEQRSFVCGPDTDGDIVTINSLGGYFLSHHSNWKIAPLCWVEFKPVYPDSILYDKHTGQQYLGKDISGDVCYTWKKSKQKKTGWLNIYPTCCWEAVTSAVFTTEKEADKHAALGRVACIKIEWEE